MKRLILSFIISTTLLSAEITKENIGNYIYIRKPSIYEYKVKKNDNGKYLVIKLPNEKCVYESLDIDGVLAYIKSERLEISRECGKLEVKEMKKED